MSTNAKGQIIPTLGRIILYTLTAEDANKINRQRTTGGDIQGRIVDGRWPEGAQAHIGNEARAGQVYPGIVVNVWGDELLNAQIFLDGNDTYWVTSVGVHPEGCMGMYHWMPYQKAQAAAT